jgi:hypothetical protein
MTNTELLGTQQADTIRVYLELCNQGALHHRPANVVLHQALGFVLFSVQTAAHKACIGRWNQFNASNCGRINNVLFYFDVPFDDLLPHAPDSHIYIHTSMQCASRALLHDKMPAVLEAVISGMCGCCCVHSAAQLFTGRGR